LSAFTGGQYSVYRFLLGLYLCVHFAQLVPYGPEVFSHSGVLPDARLSPFTGLFPNFLRWFDGPLVVQGALLAGVFLSAALAIGRSDRLAAVLIWYLWACLFGRNPLISNPGLPYIGLLLVVHALLPAGPYGSWRARGRADPGGDWAMDRNLWRVVWILMAVGYTYSGVSKLSSPSWTHGEALEQLLHNPLARPGWIRDALLGLSQDRLHGLTWLALAGEILFAPLALLRWTRPWIWLAMVGMHLGILLVVDFADLSLGMLLVHLFTFDPRWVPAIRPAQPETVYYDGECGLCHGAVRFLLSEDPEGVFLLAPLQSEAFEQATADIDRTRLPDSILIQSEAGGWLAKGKAVRHLLAELGGLWRVLGWFLAAIPGPILDGLYDLVAKVRRRVFPKPEGLCPLVPPHLGKRFLA